jgi:hypothetical protein
MIRGRLGAVSWVGVRLTGFLLGRWLHFWRSEGFFGDFFHFSCAGGWWWLWRRSSGLTGPVLVFYRLRVELRALMLSTVGTWGS